MKSTILIVVFGASLALAQTVPQISLGVYNSSPPSLSSGNYSALQLDSSGNLLVNIKAGSSGNSAASATGSAVPASADYTGVNIGGTLRGQTGVNPTGTVYAAQTDLTSANGVSLGSPSNYGTSPGAVSVIGVNAFVTNSPAVSQSGTWNVGISAGTNLIGYSRAQNACGTTNYEGGMQMLPAASTSLTATATCVVAMIFNNTDTAQHTISVQDQSTACNSAACQVLTSFPLPPASFVRLQFDGDKFVGGIKWNADVANKVVADVIGNQ